MKQKNRLALLVAAAGILAGLAAVPVPAEPQAATAAAPVAVAATQDEPAAGLVRTDWNPSVDSLRAPSAALGGSGMGPQFASRLSNRAATADSVGKERLRAGHWLLLSGFVGLLGATRRRRAR